MAGHNAGTTASSGAGPTQDASKSTPQDNSPASSVPSATQPPAAPAAPKRQRVSRACDQCRAMREKCDGAQPHCSSCVSQRRACTYKTSPKKRGVQTGYIRTLELTLSSLLDEVPGCADALDGLFGRHGGDAAQRLFNPEANAANPAQQQKDLERHNRLHRRWHKSRARREINRLLSTDGFSAGVSRPLSDRTGSDEDTDQEPSSSAGQTSRPAAAGGTSTVTWSPSETTIPSPLSGHDDASFPLSQPSRTPLPPNHWRLLDVYFSYTHCWFPILERQDVLKAVYQYERELGEPTSAPAQSTSSTSAATAELWSVLAVASFQDAAARKQAQQHNDPTQTPSTSTTTTSTQWPAWPPYRIYNIARQMIPLDDGPFEVQHARALLLLALVNIGRRRYTAARVLISLARQIVQDADCLSRVTDYNHGQHGYGPMSMRRRIVDAVTSGCSILDAFISMVRSSLRQPQQPQHPPPIRHTPSTPQHRFYPPAVPEDGLDEWQPWVPCIGFGVEDAASERSPAYSLTTFNQLHALFTCMQQQDPSAPSPADYNDGIAAGSGSGFTADGDALDRVLRPDVPFSAFVRSNERLSAAVPSAYILRITYLWMQSLLALSSRSSGQRDADARIHLLADVVEQFVARFGAAGAPPTLVSCVLTVVEHPSFKLLPPPLQQRLCVLGDSLEAVWHVPEQQPAQGQKQHQQQQQQQQQQQLPMPAVPTTTPRSNAVLRQKMTPTAAPTSNPPVTVYQSASPEAAVVHQQQQRPAARHHRMSFLETPQSQAQPPPTQTQQTQQTPDVNMYNGSHPPSQHPSGQAPPAFGFHPLPISPPTAGTVSSDHHSSTNYPSHTQPIMATPYNDANTMAVDSASAGSFDGAPFSGAPGSNTLDYEALLDDLSAVDYLDRLDADIGSQFMANLGFAPGMDNNLIWNP